MDNETQRYIDARKIKQERLRILDEQAARFGDLYVPPHVQMERVQLRAELEAFETVIASPLRPEVGDDLGERGRFLIYHQQNREIKQSIATLAVRLDEFIDGSQEWRSVHRQWLLIIGVAVLIILIIVVVIVTYLVTIGAV